MMDYNQHNNRQPNHTIQPTHTNQPELECGECSGKVVESATLPECHNVPVQQKGYAKIPIVLAEFTVQIDVESKIKLEEKAVEIKRIKKNVFLTQCRLIGKTHKLFLKGFIRKNIEYATVDSFSRSSICGDIKHTTVYVPFQCITEVCLNPCPMIEETPPSEEIIYFDEKNMGRDMKEVDFVSEEFFNEKVFCELIKAKIFEADIADDTEKLECHPVERVFRSFTEKEVVYLTLKLLQKQQVCH